MVFNDGAGFFQRSDQLDRAKVVNTRHQGWLQVRANAGTGHKAIKAFRCPLADTGNCGSASIRGGKVSNNIGVFNIHHDYSVAGLK